MFGEGREIERSEYWQEVFSCCNLSYELYIFILILSSDGVMDERTGDSRLSKVRLAKSRAELRNSGLVPGLLIGERLLYCFVMHGD